MPTVKMGETAPHPVLVGVHDDRVVVVDEQGAQRRVDVVLDQVPTEIDQIERASARGRQIRPLQFGERLRKGVTGAEGDAAAFAELAEQCRQGDRGADAAAAVAAAF